MAYEFIDETPKGRYEFIDEPVPEKSIFSKALQGYGNVQAGLLRGAGSIGATILAPYDYARDFIDRGGFSDKVSDKTLSGLVTGNQSQPLNRNEQRRADMDSALASLGAETDSFGYGAGKLGGEILGTAGAGGLIARPLAGVAPRLAQAIGSGGFATGAPAAATRLGQAADMGIRVAGGAINGGISAGMVGDNPAMGAAIGGALPPVAKAVGLVGGAVGRGVSSVLTPEKQNMAAKISAMTGQKIEDVIAALDAQGPSILGIKPTVPQVLQDPAISQLQRTAINAGDKAIMAREVEQNLQRLDGFNRVAPVMGTVNEAADNAGNMIGNFGKSARANESQRVSNLFDSVDPFNETALTLPIDAMKAQRDKFLGSGTFGAGTAPQTAINTAESIGTQVLDAIQPLKPGKAINSQNLEQAVRAAGGIRGRSGELRDLGIKESGTTGLINNKSGQAEDLLAEEMYRRGFISDPDPRTLLDALRNGGGRKIYANDAVENNGLQRMLEGGMGDAPGAEIIAKPVTFDQVQNLRGSLNQAWKSASMSGSNQEAAALKGMIAEIDSSVNAVSNGKGSPDDYFPPDVVNNWREALAAHAMKKQRFDTGPQARMFRQGSDGQSAIQGAEIPREFFNSRTSQIEDAKAFQRLTQDNPQLVNALKSYAMTDAAQQTTKDGMLSFNKFDKWMDSRAGAIKNTMTESDQALLKEVLQGVKASDFAATGGMAKGSNTEQNRQAAQRAIGSGLLDSSVANVLFAKTPIIGQFTGPMLDGLRKSSQASKAQTLGGLLADPEIFSAELRKLLARQQPGQLRGLLGDPGLSAMGYRAAPILMGD